MIKNDEIIKIYQDFENVFSFLPPDILKALFALNLHLKSIKIPYIVVGSVALKVLGVPINRELHDIDIEVVCDEKQELVFKKIAEAQGTNLHKVKETNLPGFEHKPYVFNIFNVQINVWISREKFSHPNILQKCNICFPTIDSLLKTKAIYHRPKDLNDFLYITEQLLTTVCGKENLNDFLEKINLKDIEKIIIKK